MGLLCFRLFLCVRVRGGRAERAAQFWRTAAKFDTGWERVRETERQRERERESKFDTGWERVRETDRQTDRERESIRIELM